jgi:hypothetical protein
MKPTGQQALHDDVSRLLFEIKNGEFGDFTNEKYAAPKMELAKIFYQLYQNTIDGRYDD